MKKLIKSNADKVLIALVILIVILTPLGGIFIISNGHPYSMYIINKKVEQHLYNSGYTHEDLKEAHFLKEDRLDDRTFYEGLYMVNFIDEPNINYYYAVTKDNKEVKQIAEKEKTLMNGDIQITTETTRHTEEYCIKGCF